MENLRKTCSDGVMAPAPDPVVLRGHGADVQCVTFANLHGIHCVLSGCVATLAPRSRTWPENTDTK